MMEQRYLIEAEVAVFLRDAVQELDRLFLTRKRLRIEELGALSYFLECADRFASGSAQPHSDP